MKHWHARRLIDAVEKGGNWINRIGFLLHLLSAIIVLFIMHALLPLEGVVPPAIVTIFYLLFCKKISMLAWGILPVIFLFLFLAKNPESCEPKG